MTSTPPDFRPFTDRAAMRRDFDSFLINPRPIQTMLVPINTSSPPCLILSADAALRDLVRLYATDIGPNGDCDVLIDHRTMIDGPGGIAKLALRFQWTDPAVYKMTIIMKLPKHLPCLLAALAAGGIWCQDAPFDPHGMAIWLPLDREDLAPHVIGAAAILTQRRAA